MPTFYIEQFGCRATQADGAALERQLLDRGCTSAAEAAAADIVVMNTCTVTAAADAQFGTVPAHLCGAPQIEEVVHYISVVLIQIGEEVRER